MMVDNASSKGFFELLRQQAPMALLHVFVSWLLIITELRPPSCTRQFDPALLPVLPADKQYHWALLLTTAAYACMCIQQTQYLLPDHKY